VIPEMRANTFLAGKGGCGQGDHVCVNFRLLCDCLTSLGSVLKITGVAQIYGLVFFRDISCELFGTKIGWAINVCTFWAPFSLTHLVTLDVDSIYLSRGRFLKQSLLIYKSTEIFISYAHEYLYVPT
jgi:hypothetical protein